jgi:hypothetical protein
MIRNPFEAAFATASFSFLSTRKAGGEDQGEGGLDDRRDIDDVDFPATAPSPSFE